jgi:hypothetical protein
MPCFCPPSSSTDAPVQVSEFAGWHPGWATVQGACSPLRRRQASVPAMRGQQPSGLRQITPKWWSPAIPPQGGRVGRRPCAIPRVVMPLRPCAYDWPLCHVAHCHVSPRGDADSSPATMGTWICSGRLVSGGFAVLLGGGWSCDGSAKYPPPGSSGMAGVPALITGEHCALAAWRKWVVATTER